MLDDTSTQAQTVGIACGASSVLILISRLAISQWRREPVNLSFWLVVLSIVAIVARTVTNSLYLDFGTSSQAHQYPDRFDDANSEQVKIGSMLVIATRVLMTAVLWLQICILLVFYSRITSGLRWARLMINATWVVVILTSAAVILATFLECRPVHRYWQIDPNPGTCICAFTQLLIQGISNTVMDLMLLVIAWPLVRLKKRNLHQYISLYTLFALGTFCTVITVIRVVLFFRKDSSQITRSVWASAQMIVSCFVANAPTIYGSLRVVRRRRSVQRSDAGDNGRRKSWPPDTFSPMRIDEETGLAPRSRGILAPLPPASTFYDDATAPAPHDHAPYGDRHQNTGPAMGNTFKIDVFPESTHVDDVRQNGLGNRSAPNVGVVLKYSYSS
ncbi:hypothetical protein F4779DRAFT_609893 [Xylariaceae sp. FL0662B]|nr:hypothetical protein F4779DRAFT_609893 [Xylariaceae sp. FL0662B]